MEVPGSSPNDDPSHQPGGGHDASGMEGWFDMPDAMPRPRSSTPTDPDQRDAADGSEQEEMLRLSLEARLRGDHDESSRLHHLAVELDPLAYGRLLAEALQRDAIYGRSVGDAPDDLDPRTPTEPPEPEPPVRSPRSVAEPTVAGPSD